MRIIFMGTPEFAVPSLEKLIEAGKNIVAVITAPDRPAGRGLQILSSPVKDCAVKYNIPVLQPEKLKSPGFIEDLRIYKADLQIVVAFRMLPEIVWAMPKYGTFNLHASLLPQYRGAAPINWAIINGENETGLTTFFLQHEIDTGNIIFQEKEIIYDYDNAGSLYERLMHKGGDLIVKTVEAIENNNFPQLPQDMQQEIKLAPKIFKETCEINWQQSTNKVYDFIRGMAPYPSAWTTINGKFCKILQTEKVNDSKLTHGQLIDMDKMIIETDQKTFIHFKTIDGWIKILGLQMEGKKRMKTEEFLRGYKIKPD